MLFNYCQLNKEKIQNNICTLLRDIDMSVLLVDKYEMQLSELPQTSQFCNLLILIGWYLC